LLNGTSGNKKISQKTKYIITQSTQVSDKTNAEKYFRETIMSASKNYCKFHTF